MSTLGTDVAVTGPAIGVGAGILTTGGATGGWAYWGGQITYLQNEIEDDKAKIRAERKQIISLGALEKSVNTVTSSITEAETSLSNVRDSWANWGKILDEVISELEKPNANLPVVLAKLDVESAMNDWKDLNDWAEALNQMPVQIEHKEFKLPNKQG